MHLFISADKKCKAQQSGELFATVPLSLTCLLSVSFYWILPRAPLVNCSEHRWKCNTRTELVGPVSKGASKMTWNPSEGWVCNLVIRTTCDFLPSGRKDAWVAGRFPTQPSRRVARPQEVWIQVKGSQDGREHHCFQQEAALSTTQSGVCVYAPQGRPWGFLCLRTAYRIGSDVS